MYIHVLQDPGTQNLLFFMQENEFKEFFKEQLKTFFY